MEHLFSRKKSLQIGDEKWQSRIVERRQFLVQFGVVEDERPFGLFQLLFGAADFDLFALLRLLQRLETVPLAVVVDEFPPSLVDLFLYCSIQIVTVVNFLLPRRTFTLFFLLVYTYPHFWELALVGVERDEHLVSHLVS